MNRDLNCLRCDGKMDYMKMEKIQLGQTSFLFGDTSNRIAGALEADIYSCNLCGKIEFFIPLEEEDRIEQMQCPYCGKTHDIDYPKCPFCKYKYY